MPGLTAFLITGRTTRQGIGLVLGKDSEQYSQEVNSLEISPEDMDKMGIKPGDILKVSSAHGSVSMRCRQGNLPPGIVFVPFGPAANLLIGGDTQGTGMPDSKGLEVRLELLE